MRPLQQLFGCVLAAFFSVPSLAQIKTDGSVGPAAQSLSAVGGQFTIPQTLGRLSGSNLFHSFKDFNINTGESATFTTSSTGISNVISRVTGGNVSNINGTLALRAAEGAPAFWFINPAGVAFGQGASIDVPGAFHVSTAHYLKFPDGKFYSDTQNVSTFSSAPPEAFGFLGTTRASIEVTAGAKLNNGDNTLNLIAGDITIDGSELSISGGSMNLVALGDAAAEVSISGIATQVATGLIKIVNDSRVTYNTSSEAKGGDLSITSGTLLIDRSVLSSDPSGTGSAGAVRIQVADTMSVLNESYVGSQASGDGDGADVWVSAGTLVINNKSYIASNTVGIGRGGVVSIQVAGDMSLHKESFVSSTTFGLDMGKGGDAGSVSVTARSLLLDNSGICSDTYGSGRAGTVKVQVAGAIRMMDASYISSDSMPNLENGNEGNAGDVTVKSNSLHIEGSSGISSNSFGSGSGRAGAVSVDVSGDMSVINNGRISSSTFTLGNAGSVNVHVSGAIQILSGGEILSCTFGAGDAGYVTVTAGSLWIDAKDFGIFDTGIASSSEYKRGQSPVSTGDAGTVNIRIADELLILNGGGISSQTYSPRGKAGSIIVNAGQILIDGVAKLPDYSQESYISAAANSGSSGKTGSIMVTATDSIRVENGGVISLRNDATVTNPQTTVPTTLAVTAPSIFLNNGGLITTASTGNIAASNIAVQFTDKLSVHQTSAVTTSSVDGNGGAIDISGMGLLLLDRANITTSVTGASGNAGSIKMGAKTLLMTNGFIQANTSAPLASGGTIQIGAEALVSSFGTLYVGGSTPYAFDAVKPGFNVIQAASPTGVSGDIAITTPNLDLAGKLAGLKVNLLESGGFSRNPCVGSGASSFALTGRGGLPVSSIGALASSSVKIDTQNAIQVEPFNFAPPQTTLASAQLGCRRS